MEREEWHRGISPLLTFWKKLNKGQDWLRVTLPPSVNEGTIITTFMYEEKRFAIELIQSVHRSLSALSKVTRGAALPTEKDTEIVNNLLAYQVSQRNPYQCNIHRNLILHFQTPNDWLTLWKGPTEPYKYLQTIIDKVSVIYKWNIGNDDVLLKSDINLSSLYRPNVFLAALKQHTAR